MIAVALTGLFVGACGYESGEVSEAAQALDCVADGGSALAGAGATSATVAKTDGGQRGLNDPIGRGQASQGGAIQSSAPSCAHRESEQRPTTAKPAVLRKHMTPEERTLLFAFMSGCWKCYVVVCDNPSHGAGCGWIECYDHCER